MRDIVLGLLKSKTRLRKCSIRQPWRSLSPADTPVQSEENYAWVVRRELDAIWRKKTSAWEAGGAYHIGP
ncbi:MAG: hypothetical protein ACLT8C_05075 [Akkermansia muciniphila]